jgi:hypothetical protein
VARVLVVVGWEGLATVEQHGYAQCHHHAPLSAALRRSPPLALTPCTRGSAYLLTQTSSKSHVRDQGRVHYMYVGDRVDNASTTGTVMPPLRRNR